MTSLAPRLPLLSPLSSLRVWHAACVVLCCLCLTAAEARAQGPVSQVQALERLHRDFPGVRVYDSGGRVRKVYGGSMTEAASPEEAALA